MKFNIKDVKGKNGWRKFYGIIAYFQNNKQDIKGEKLANGMTITGIGKKCLKVENNFYSWDDIENVACGAEETEDNIMQNILEFIFEDYTVEKDDDYTQRKFDTSEDFTQIKKEILENKEHYKTDSITGIGEKAIMIGRDYEAEYVSWEKIREIISTTKVADYLATHYKYDATCIVLRALFEDDAQTSVEKRLYEKGEKYAEEKAYIYRQILSDSLTVENIRSMVFRRYDNYNEDSREEVVTKLLQFAFKYIKEVRFTNDDYDEEDYNTYAIKDGEYYVYTIKNKEIEYNEEKEGFTFINYKKVVFRPCGYNIEIYRKGKKVGSRPAGYKPIYARRRNTQIPVTYELSVEQQIEIIKKGGIREISDEKIKQYFLEVYESETEIGEELRETITEVYKEANIEELYNKSEEVQKVAKQIYGNKQVGSTFLRCMNYLTLFKKVDERKIINTAYGDDSNMSQIAIQDDKYHFANKNSKTVRFGGLFEKEYAYLQNCEYTQISHSSAYIDTFTVFSVILRDDVSEDEAVYLFEYAEAKWIVEDDKNWYTYDGSSRKI